MHTESRTHMGHRIARVTAIVLLALIAVGRPAAAVDSSPRSPEYLIKAAYLYNFAMFVEWPAEAFRAADSPIVIGIVGSDPFGWAIDRIVQDTRINKRRIVVERLQSNQDVRHCHIVVVSASDTARISELAQRLDGMAILIVGDTADAARRGGTVDFTVNDNKVGFEINLDAARRARLTISSKMLSLARIVRGS